MTTDVLTKDTLINVIRGTPDIPAVPASAAWTETVTTTGLGILWWQYGYVNNLGQLIMLPPGVFTAPGGFPVVAIPVYGYVTTTTYIFHPAVTGSPFIPGTPDVTTVDFQLGWNSGARSVSAFVGTQMTGFSIDASAVGVVCGLNQNNVDTTYAEIEYGFFAESGLYRVIENGVIMTGYATYTTASVFYIVRLGDEVAYWLDKGPGPIKVYTSLSRSYEDFFLDCSMYSGGDRIL